MLQILLSNAGQFFIGYLAGLMLIASPMLQAQSSEDGLVWVEAQVDITEPYVQQTLIYTVRVTSTAQVKTLSPNAPMLPGAALLEKLDQQPHFYTTQQQGTTYSVSEFRYALTPLTFGRSRIPPTNVDISYTNTGTVWNSYPYAGTNHLQKVTLQTNPIDLQIKPPASGNQGDWLPLLALTLDAKLDTAPHLGVGDPLTLTLTTNALGITGAQLPEPQLPIKPDDFKLYSDRPQFGRRLVRNDSVLQGWRIDTYTLIPKRTGTLSITELQMHWWSLREEQSTWAKLPMQLISVLDPAAAATQSAKQPAAVSTTGMPLQPASSGIAWFSWLLSNVLILTVGWWLGAGRPGKEVLYAALLQAHHWLLSQSLSTWQKLRALAQQSPWLENVRTWQHKWHTFPKPWRKPALNAPEMLENPVSTKASVSASGFCQTGWHKLVWCITPAPLRALQFLRAIDNETEPLHLSGIIQAFAHAQLNTSINTPLLHLATRFAHTYPHMDAKVLQNLFKPLDQLHYDRPGQFKLQAWKAECRRVFQYLPLRQAQLAGRNRQSLPELNPVQ